MIIFEVTRFGPPAIDQCGDADPLLQWPDVRGIDDRPWRRILEHVLVTGEQLSDLASIERPSTIAGGEVDVA